MLRDFNSSAPEQLIESAEFQQMYGSLKYINSVTEPPKVEGTLWANKLTGDLKYCMNGQWIDFYENKFQITDQITADAPDPSTAVTGQLWINTQTKQLNYFDGTMFTPVKAETSDAGYGYGLMDFLTLGPMDPLANISYLGDINTAVSNFLVPNSALGKVFLDSNIDDTYTKPSGVSVQYDYNDIIGKKVTAVHVLPDRLLDIKKKIFKINKPENEALEVWPVLNRYIDMPSANTEFYGFLGEKGSLLLNTGGDDGNFKPYKQGIVLSTAAAKAYDYIVAVNYVFGSAKKKGTCDTIGMGASDQSKIIYIGSIDEPLVLFVNGVAMYESENQYTYTKETGFLTINGEVSAKANATVLSFPLKTSGKASNLAMDGNSKTTFVISGLAAFNKPLVFVNGLALSQDLGQIVYDDVAHTITVTYNENDPALDIAALNTAGVPYMVVETVDKLKSCDMYAKSGTVQADPVPNIPFTTGANTEEIINGETVRYDIPYDIDGERYANPIIFIQGLCVPQEEIDLYSNTMYTANSLAAGMKYILLRNIMFVDTESELMLYNRIIFDAMTQDITIPFNMINDGIVYADDKLVMDSSYGSNGDAAKNFEIKKSGLQWVYYDNGTEHLVDEATTSSLKAGTAQYLRTSSSISINTAGVTSKVRCYAYRYANSIQYPLETMTFQTNDEKLVYSLYYKHSYAPSTNSITLWQNGLRQHGIIESSPYTANFAETIDGEGRYVIEKPESGESESCTRVVLDHRNKVSGVDNIFVTSASLNTGNLRMFISGLRQPQSAYTLLTPYMIKINGDVIGGSRDFSITQDGYYNKPEVVEIDGVPDVRYVPLKQFDEILIELRTDYRLKECHVPVRITGQNTLLKNADGIPDGLFAATDKITIYLDGLVYDCRELTDAERNTRQLFLSETIIDGIEPGKDSFIIEWR
jgi:hypothetical protein